MFEDCLNGQALLARTDSFLKGRTVAHKDSEPINETSDKKGTMGTKFVVNSRDTEPGDPPSLAVVTLELEESDVSYEYEVIQAIFQTVGEGYYTVLSNLGENDFKVLWKGRVEEKDDRISYHTDESHLWDKAWMKIKEKPIQGAWKVCRKEKVIDEDYVKYHDQ